MKYLMLSQIPISAVLLLSLLGLISCYGPSSAEGTPVTDVVVSQQIALTTSVTIEDIVAELLDPTRNGLNILIDDSLGIALKRAEWTKFVSMTFGTAIRKGDLIQPTGEVRVLCSDITIKFISEESGTPCPNTPPALKYRDLYLVPPQAEYYSPLRITSTLNVAAVPLVDTFPAGQVRIEWIDVGASEYNVVIGPVETWQGYLTQNKLADLLARADDRPSPEWATAQLRPYPLTVITGITRSHLDVSPLNLAPGSALGDLVFVAFSNDSRGYQITTVNTPDNADIQSVRQKAIMSLPVQEDKRQFVLALYYMNQTRYSDALALLDTLQSSSLFTTPAYHRLRGELLEGLGRQSEARVAYETAVSSAINLGDLEAQAMSRALLWQLTKEASQREAIVELYSRLGDANAVAILNTIALSNTYP